MVRASLLLIVMMAWDSNVDAASIGIFANSDCSSCALQIPVGETGTINISVVGSVYPILGAYLGVEGLPEGWIATAIPSPAANLSIGDPFGTDGAIVSFPSLQSGPCILLYTVFLRAPGQPASFDLHVIATTLPGTPACPAIIECRGDPCEFIPPVCVPGGALLVNSLSDCNVPVASQSWGGTRALYR
jgi:hypothetical protein